MRHGSVTTGLRVGVLADTHGFLDPRVPRLYAGVDLILHAGDVGDASILEELSHVAPVIAVRGNVDEGSALDHLPESVSLSVAGQSVYMTHIFTPPGQGGPGDPVPPGTRIAVFGHSHIPFLEESGPPEAPVLYFNPASAGRKRFGKPRLAGMLTIGPGGVHAEHLDLESPQ